MKKTWSPKWRSSTQPRKQRKFRHNAPLHVRHAFLSAHLSKELRRQYSRRSFPLRKGDEVEIMRGDKAGLRAPVQEIRQGRAYLEGQMVKKVSGSEVLLPFQPSNLKIIKLNTDDKRRLAALLKKREPAKTVVPPSQEKTKKTAPAKGSPATAQLQKPITALLKKPAQK